jgi:hypothetical protein
MALTNTDLLLVQRGATPHKTEASALATYIKNEVDASDIEIASASQLGVIRVGNNLQINPATGILDAVIPAGLEYRGVLTDPTDVPSPLQNGYFWIWDGGDGITLNNAAWGSANGETVNDGDKIFYDGSQFDIIPAEGGGISSITGVAPITVDFTDPSSPEIGINSATPSSEGSLSAADKAKLDSIEAGAEANVAQNLSYAPSANNGVVEIDNGGTNATIPTATAAIAGLMSSADKSILDNLTASPGGVLSVVAGDGINVDSSNAGAPVVSVEFGATPNGTPVTVMPYDISSLAELT